MTCFTSELHYRSLATHLSHLLMFSANVTSARGDRKINTLPHLSLNAVAFLTIMWRNCTQLKNVQTVLMSLASQTQEARVQLAS